MTLNPPKNPNYCATVVEVKNIIPLSGCDNVVSTGIFGNAVIVGKDTQIGTKGLFFPVETQLSEEFLKMHNLYRKAELNQDPKLKGYFEENGRVKAVKFRGHKSEGFFIPIHQLSWVFANETDPLQVGDEFDEIHGLEICRKYIPKRNRSQQVAGKQSNKKAVRISRLVEHQFRLHYETAQLKKNMHQIHPDDLISVTDKWHGTSFVVGNVLTLRPLKWYEKILGKLGVNVQETQYDIIYSSRKVVKNGFINKESNHFYSYDLWKEIADQIGPSLPPGITVYGEAVGYLKTGAMIQPGYHYNAKPNQFKLLIYRVTTTNTNGDVIELSWPQLKEFCLNHGFEHVHEFYYGPARMLYDTPMRSSIEYGDDHGSLQDWQDYFLEMLMKDTRFNMGDSMCPSNNLEVPAEGVVIRKDFLKESAAFKLKNFKFLEWETKQLDSGSLDIETEQSENEDEQS